MSYDPAVLRRATARLEGERRAREERQQALRRAACQRQPRLSEIDRQLRGTMTELFAASLRRGEGGAPTVEEVRRKNLALQQERAELLARMDLAEDASAPVLDAVDSAVAAAISAVWAAWEDCYE